MIVGLLVILALVLFLPFSVKLVERNLELFLFFMGIVATVVSSELNLSLLSKAIKDPLYITVAVFIAGLFFKWLQKPIEKGIGSASEAMPFRLFIALFVIILGLISSVITAIMAAIVLVAVVSVLNLERKSSVRLVILACYSIGLGAVLTPIGEPLSTITTNKLNEQFSYLFTLLAADVIPGLIVFGLLAAIIVQPTKRLRSKNSFANAESYGDIIIRSFKVYLFVMALTLLGFGFEPLIQRYLLDVSPYALYWINMISAVLDNATLAAAEISPDMDAMTIKAILLGLLVSGGMLIPGNIPNIIAAGKMNITSIEWARFGVPIGLFAMIVYFVVIIVAH